MDIQLSYVEQGLVYPLLLLHGNGESSALFQKHMARFAAMRHVFAVDTRGHGRSRRGTRPFTLEQFAEDLHAFMILHNIPCADILGYSDGGNIAMLFALRYPTCVRGLILVGANTYPTGMHTGAWLAILSLWCLFGFLAPFSAQMQRKWELYGLMARQPHISFTALATIQAPTLVLAGTHDLIRASHTRKIAAALPHSTLRLIPGGHMLVTEQPEAFATSVANFLKTLDAPFHASTLPEMLP